MYNYAQLDKEGFCIAISQLSNKIDDPKLILIDKLDTNFIDRKYDIENKKWTDLYKKQDTDDIEISKTLIIAQQLSELEVQQLEYNKQATEERIYLGRQISELELSLLERGM